MLRGAKFEYKLVAMLVFLMLIAVGIAIASWQLIGEVKQSEQWLEHSHKVITTIDDVLVDSLRIEYAVQNFRLTGDSKRMDDRKKFTALRETALLELQQLISDNARQQNCWKNLRQVIDTRIAYADKIQQLRNAKGYAATESYIRTVQLEEMRNRTYQILAGMKAEEARLLDVRQNDYRRRHQALLFASVLIAVFLCLIAVGIALLIRAQRRKDKTKQAELEHLMQTDPLTGINNRRMIMTYLEQELARSKRYSTTFALAYMDIDHFKHINDQYGHCVGDTVLVQVANCLRSNLRQTDHLARFGGEEFLVLLPETTLENARVILEKLRVSVSSLQITKLDRSVTISAGLAQWQNDESGSELLSRANKALYRAKENGRNCIGVSP